MGIVCPVRRVLVVRRKAGGGQLGTPAASREFWEAPAKSWGSLAAARPATRQLQPRTPLLAGRNHSSQLHRKPNPPPANWPSGR